ncbi:hypothetical protein [Streptomyces sp. GMY02]|uniref:hypothetical protein n=1 Tax=Streptomyces sp. GMY02 TaxID=1333528 RepID=UPI0020B77A15|nr:hypothetical protein [Streptomyces sp. GMY02]
MSRPGVDSGARHVAERNPAATVAGESSYLEQFAQYCQAAAPVEAVPLSSVGTVLAGLEEFTLRQTGDLGIEHAQEVDSPVRD